jgi:putative MFS transporter
MALRLSILALTPASNVAAPSPTRLRCGGTGFGSAWLRAGSAAGPILVEFIVGDFGIRYVFTAFAAVALIGGIVTLLCAIETKAVIEELSP